MRQRKVPARLAGYVHNINIKKEQSYEHVVEMQDAAPLDLNNNNRVEHEEGGDVEEKPLTGMEELVGVKQAPPQDQDKVLLILLKKTTV